MTMMKKGCNSASLEVTCIDDFCYPKKHAKIEP